MHAQHAQLTPYDFVARRREAERQRRRTQALEAVSATVPALLSMGIGIAIGFMAGVVLHERKTHHSPARSDVMRLARSGAQPAALGPRTQAPVFFAP